jgi:YfiH family protein
MRDQGPLKNSHHKFTSYKTPFSKIRIRQFSDLLCVPEGVTYFQYPGLSQNRTLVHAVFARRGGVSDAPYDTLNTSYTVGDLPENVSANLLKIKEVVGAAHLVFMNQLHGDQVLVLHQGNFEPSGKVPLADAMITDIPRIGLMVKQADCQGVVLYDPKQGVVATVHCGWRGNVQNILAGVVTRMEKDFGCEGPDILAALSPSLGPCCAEFLSHDEIFPRGFERFEVRENYFDLWALSCSQLVEAGLREENIEIAAVCTRCRTDLFYSYRGEGATGRFATVAMLL